jgi:hypothetical protein
MIATEINVTAPLTVFFDGCVNAKECGSDILLESEPQSVSLAALQQQAWQAIPTHFNASLKQPVIG